MKTVFPRLYYQRRLLWALLKMMVFVSIQVRDVGHMIELSYHSTVVPQYSY